MPCSFSLFWYTLRNYQCALTNCIHDVYDRNSRTTRVAASEQEGRDKLARERLNEDGQTRAPSAAHEPEPEGKERLARCPSGEPIALLGGPYQNGWMCRDPDAGGGEQGGALVHRDGPRGNGPHITEKRKTAQRLDSHSAQGAGGSDSEGSEGASPRTVGHYGQGRPGVWQVELQKPVADEKGESREVYRQVR